MYTVLPQRIVIGRQRGLVIWLLLVYFWRIDRVTSRRRRSVGGYLTR